MVGRHHDIKKDWKLSDDKSKSICKDWDNRIAHSEVVNSGSIQ
jgi:hypothetical protein